MNSLFLENNTQTNLSVVHFFLPLRFLESASSLSEADITPDVLAEIQTYENSYSLIVSVELKVQGRISWQCYFLQGCSRFLDKCVLFSPELVF